MKHVVWLASGTLYVVYASEKFAQKRFFSELAVLLKET